MVGPTQSAKVVLPRQRHGHVALSLLGPSACQKMTQTALLHQPSRGNISAELSPQLGKAQPVTPVERGNELGVFLGTSKFDPFWLVSRKGTTDCDTHLFFCV